MRDVKVLQLQSAQPELKSDRPETKNRLSTEPRLSLEMFWFWEPNKSKGIMHGVRHLAVIASIVIEHQE